MQIPRDILAMQPNLFASYHLSDTLMWIINNGLLKYYAQMPCRFVT